MKKVADKRKEERSCHQEIKFSFKKTRYQIPLAKVELYY